MCRHFGHFDSSFVLGGPWIEAPLNEGLSECRLKRSRRLGQIADEDHPNLFAEEMGIRVSAYDLAGIGEHGKQAVQRRGHRLGYGLFRGPKSSAGCSIITSTSPTSARALFLSSSLAT